MILTITLNPSMDYSYITDALKLGKVNRVENPFISIGGKGINAGRVGAISGSGMILTGVLGGQNGHSILDTLKKEHRYSLEFLEIDGNSRNAVTIMHDQHTHTELVEKGIYLSEESEKNFYQHLSTLFDKYLIEVVCISGSVNSDNPEFYSNLMTHLRKKLGTEFPILLDISGNQLKNVLKNKEYKPTFIKPNTHEIEEILGEELTSTEDVLRVLKKDIFQGIDIVMISRGSKGALVNYKNKIYDIKIPKIKVVNTTGCGDATVGGMAHALRKNSSISDALKYSMACGMSNAQFNTNGIIDLENTLALAELVELNELSK